MTACFDIDTLELSRHPVYSHVSARAHIDAEATAYRPPRQRWSRTKNDVADTGRKRQYLSKEDWRC